MKIEYVDSILLKKAFISAANYLEANKQTVNSLNVFPVPDGDTGTNMSLTMQSAIKQIKNLDSEEIDKIGSAVSNGSLMGARGNSGVILSQFFRGFAKGLKGINKLDTKSIAKAFKMASDTAYKAVMKPTEGTILTVGRECASRAIELSRTETNVVLFMEKVIEHGEIVLSKTPEMLDVLKQAGVVDAGGKGLIYILKGGLQALISDDIVFVEEDGSTEVDHHINLHQDEKDIKFGYCTEFIINNTKADAEIFREEISKYGDSLLAVGGDNIIKIHIHTNNPGDVLQKALSLGELIDIKIDNMRYQHRSSVISTSENEKDIKKEKYGFIAVAMGEGISNVFKDLKVDYVIRGGQTMNPSTEDILNAINNVNAENIIILPNNSNIILAATQAKELSEKNIEVLPTKTIPQGITALLSFDEELEIAENIEKMKDAIKSVVTGQVTFAVRDTTINDIEIKKDDIIGLSDGEIVSVGTEINKVSVDLITRVVNDDSYLITIFYGQNIEEEKAKDLAKQIEKVAGNCDVEIVYGGQPLYYYIFSVE